jgi:glutaredoxin
MMAAGLVLPASLPASSRTVAPRAHAPSMDLFGGLKQAMYKTMAGNYDEAEVRGRLERQIKMKPCVMYADSSCPFCQQAQKALTSMGAVYSVIELDSEDDGMAMKAELIAITGQSSVPQVRRRRSMCVCCGCACLLAASARLCSPALQCVLGCRAHATPAAGDGGTDGG